MITAENYPALFRALSIISAETADGYGVGSKWEPRLVHFEFNLSVMEEPEFREFLSDKGRPIAERYDLIDLGELFREFD